MVKTKVLKTLIAGEGGVGKTTLLHRYIEGVFMKDTKMTIGVEFHLKELIIDDTKVLLQIWDFGGQERFRFLLKSYAKGAKGAVIMFDLTRPLTLENIEDWVNICRGDQPDFPIIFVGSKTDLTEFINIEEDFILEILDKYNLFNYIRVSSKTGQNVEFTFELLAREIIKYIE